MTMKTGNNKKGILKDCLEPRPQEVLKFQKFEMESDPFKFITVSDVPLNLSQLNLAYVLSFF